LDKGLDGRLLERIEAKDWTRRVMMVEFFKFSAFGLLNSAFAWILYEVLYRIDLWTEHRAVAAWSVSCTIGMIQAHYVHYKFTFDSNFPYGQRLYRAVGVYAGQLLVTTCLTYIMVEHYLIHHRISWLVNTCLFGFFNFLLIRWIAFPPEHDMKRSA